jgi:hypothetical protein
MVWLCKWANCRAVWPCDALKAKALQATAKAPTDPDIVTPPVVKEYCQSRCCAMCVI